MKKIDYGSLVKISEKAPAKYKPSLFGSVCGHRLIEDEEDASKFKVSIGTNVWLVEIADGTAYEIPEQYLTGI